MHPLVHNIKELSSEELDKKYQEISKRLQKLRAWNQHDHEMYHQLQLMLDGIDLEKEERLLINIEENNKTESSIVVNTDPLPDDEDQIAKQKPSRQKQYTIL
jgi:hypothetical protein